MRASGCGRRRRLVRAMARDQRRTSRGAVRRVSRTCASWGSRRAPARSLVFHRPRLDRAGTVVERHVVAVGCGHVATAANFSAMVEAARHAAARALGRVARARGSRACDASPPRIDRATRGSDRRSSGIAHAEAQPGLFDRREPRRVRGARRRGRRSGTEDARVRSDRRATARGQARRRPSGARAACSSRAPMTLAAGHRRLALPGRYLADRVVAVSDAACTPRTRSRRRRRQLRRLVASASSATCGPATGLRALFDLVAMPLAAMLGFRARARSGSSAARRRSAPDIGRRRCRGRSRRPAVGVAPSRSGASSSTVAAAVRHDWCLLVAPPFVSVVDARGGDAPQRRLHAPDALDAGASCSFWLLAHASAFDGPRAARVDGLARARGRAFRIASANDLQHGVVARARRAIGRAVAPRGTPSATRTRRSTKR